MSGPDETPTEADDFIALPVDEDDDPDEMADEHMREHPMLAFLESAGVDRATRVATHNRLFICWDPSKPEAT
ncbi:MAG TPA: hypothetical protein VKU41_27795 [Polyangiaceae bacterium]|nr:hypothetical protein [Polyangiaceae bacterium]